MIDLKQVADIPGIAERWQADPKAISADIQCLKNSIEDAFESHPSGHGVQWKSNIAVPEWVAEAIHFEDILPPRTVISLVWMDFLRTYSDLILAPQVRQPRAKELSEALQEIVNVLASFAVEATKGPLATLKIDSPPPAIPRHLHLLLAPALAILQRELDVANEFARLAVAAVDSEASAKVEGNPRRPKVNPKGSQSEKLVTYLAQHHQYDSSRIENYHPANSGDIAETTNVSASTISDFLKKNFPSTGRPRAGYVNACQNQATLLHWFMVKFKDNLPQRTDDIDTFNEMDIRERY